MVSILPDFLESRIRSHLEEVLDEPAGQAPTQVREQDSSTNHGTER